MITSRHITYVHVVSYRLEASRVIANMTSKNSVEFFDVSFPKKHVAHVQIDRAQKLNAFYEP